MLLLDFPRKASNKQGLVSFSVEMGQSLLRAHRFFGHTTYHQATLVKSESSALTRAVWYLTKYRAVAWRLSLLYAWITPPKLMKSLVCGKVSVCPVHPCQCTGTIWLRLFSIRALHTFLVSHNSLPHPSPLSEWISQAPSGYYALKSSENVSKWPCVSNNLYRENPMHYLLAAEVFPMDCENEGECSKPSTGLTDLFSQPREDGWTLVPNQLHKAYEAWDCILTSSSV